MYNIWPYGVTQYTEPTYFTAPVIVVSSAQEHKPQKNWSRRHEFHCFHSSYSSKIGRNDSWKNWKEMPCTCKCLNAFQRISGLSPKTKLLELIWCQYTIFILSSCHETNKAMTDAPFRLHGPLSVTWELLFFWCFIPKRRPKQLQPTDKSERTIMAQQVLDVEYTPRRPRFNTYYLHYSLLTVSSRSASFQRKCVSFPWQSHTIYLQWERKGDTKVSRIRMRWAVTLQ